MTKKHWNSLILILLVIVFLQISGMSRVIPLLQDINDDVDRGSIGGAALEQVTGSTD